MYQVDLGEPTGKPWAYNGNNKLGGGCAVTSVNSADLDEAIVRRKRLDVYIGRTLFVWLVLFLALTLVHFRGCPLDTHQAGSLLLGLLCSALAAFPPAGGSRVLAALPFFLFNFILVSLCTADSFSVLLAGAFRARPAPEHPELLARTCSMVIWPLGMLASHLVFHLANNEDKLRSGLPNQDQRWKLMTMSMLFCAVYIWATLTAGMLLVNNESGGLLWRLLLSNMTELPEGLQLHTAPCSWRTMHLLQHQNLLNSTAPAAQP